MKSSAWTTIVASALAFGCGGSMHAGTDALAEDVEAAETEMSRYDATCLAAASLPIAKDELHRHAEVMSDLLGRMDGGMDRMERMEHCGSGMIEMRGMMGQMQSEMEHHGDVIEAAPDIDDVHEECRQHRDDMRGVLDGMRRAMGGMGCRWGVASVSSDSESAERT